MVTILYNYSKIIGEDVSDIEGMSIQNFEDWTKTSTYAQAPMRWEYNEKVVIGKSLTVLGPKDTATRT